MYTVSQKISVKNFIIVHAGSKDLSLCDMETVSNVKNGVSKLKDVASRAKEVVNLVPARYGNFLLSQTVHKVNKVMQQAIGSNQNVIINKQPDQRIRNLFAWDGFRYNRVGKSELCERLCFIVNKESQAGLCARDKSKAFFSRAQPFEEGK